MWPRECYSIHSSRPNSCDPSADFWDTLTIVIRRVTAGFLVAFFAISGVCTGFLFAQQKPVQEHYVSDPDSVGFDIEPIQSQSGVSRWLATYAVRGKTAKFKIEINQARDASDKESRKLGIKTGTGRFVAVPGSDASMLLADLQKALQATKVPTEVQRVSALPFAFVSFGERESQASEGGGFNDDPPGNWTPMKIFIGEGDSEGEVFLNLNPLLRKGQFSIKDPDYGDVVLGQLAKVL